MPTAAMPQGSPTMLAGIAKDSVGCQMRLYETYGPLVAFDRGAEKTVFAFGPAANYDIFTQPETFHVFGPPGPRGSAQRLFQNGLFGLNGPKHLEHRRLLMPAVRKEVVISHAGAIAGITHDYLSTLRIGQTIDLFASMKDFALILAGKLLFGLDVIPRARELADTFQAWLDGFIGSMFEMVLPISVAPDSYDLMLKTAAGLVSHFRELIALWKPTPGAPPTMLGRLIEAQQAGQIAEVDVIGEMQTLLNASYHTTGSAMTWTLLLLAQHPQSMGTLMGELDRDGDSPYLDAVIKESLRILPPVVFALRRMAKAGTLAGHELPEGTAVFPSIYVTHRLAQSFPEPARFLPERWLGKSFSPYAYLPFGAGPRMCMGAAFSTQLLKIAIPAFVKKFRIALAPETRVDRHSNLTLGVQGRLPVTLLAQDGRFTSVPLTGDLREMVEFPQALPLRRAA